MCGNAKFRWFLLVPTLVTLFFVVASPVSWAGKLEDAQEKVRQNPNDAIGNIFVLAPPGFSLPLHVIEWFRCLPYDDLGKRQLILKSNQEHTL